MSKGILAIERKLKFGIQLVGETRPKMVMWTTIGKVQEFFLFTLISASPIYSSVPTSI
jgi:hypothetical protein